MIFIDPSGRNPVYIDGMRATGAEAAAVNRGTYQYDEEQTSKTNAENNGGEDPPPPQLILQAGLRIIMWWEIQ